jgi:hypothetical protein
VSRQPEGADVGAADLLDHVRDDVLQVLVVAGRPDPLRRERRRDHQPMLRHVVEQREVVALPVAVGAAAMEAEDERHRLAPLQVARVIEKVVASALRFDDRSAVGHDVTRTVLVGTVHHGRRQAGRAVDAQRLRRNGRGAEPETHDGAGGGAKKTRLHGLS